MGMDIWAGPAFGQALIPGQVWSHCSMQAHQPAPPRATRFAGGPRHQPGRRPGRPLCRRASSSTDIQRNTLSGAPHCVLPFYLKIHLKLMLSQFIPVEPGSGGGRCCLQGRRCPFRILSNADGGAVNTTDGGGRGRGRIQHRSHRQAHWFSLPKWSRGVFTLAAVQ